MTSRETIDTVTSHASLEDDLAACVGCGLCLPHCPTFRVTGEEGHSPRGRITLIRSSLEDGIAADRDVRAYLDTCVQCRGCEPACPSGVEYGRILAAINRRDESRGRRPGVLLRVFLFVLRHPILVRITGRIGLIINAIPGSRSALPARIRLRGIPIRQGRRLHGSASSPQVWLYTGCVMDTWFRSVHRATAALVEACGFSLATPRVSGCCGALHAHAGVEGIAREMALKTMDSMPGDEPIVVNSAGCGAMLREYGELLGTESAHAFSARVMDIHEWIEEHHQRLVSLDRRRRSRSSTQSPFVVQEPCHLKHVQRISLSDVLAKFVPVIRLDDDGLCCGAGGAYSLMQSDMSKEIRSRKSEAIRRASGRTTPYVVTANPGCHLHLAGDGHTMISSVEVIAGSLGLVDLDPFEREDRTSHDF